MNVTVSLWFLTNRRCAYSAVRALAFEAVIGVRCINCEVVISPSFLSKPATMVMLGPRLFAFNGCNGVSLALGEQLVRL